jgi:hypothetical protein
VLIFVQTDCPISNRYAPEVQRLHDRFSSHNIVFYLVYPDPTQTADTILAHQHQYHLPSGAIRDPHHVLVARAGVTVTPEAAVFVEQELVYRGRIDDRFVEFGTARIEPQHRDLEEALTWLVEGKAVRFHATKALGCFIPDLTP